MGLFIVASLQLWASKKPVKKLALYGAADSSETWVIGQFPFLPISKKIKLSVGFQLTFTFSL
jgi:hypothetical protein